VLCSRAARSARCADQGLSELDEVIEVVLNDFPEAIVVDIEVEVNENVS